MNASDLLFVIFFCGFFVFFSWMVIIIFDFLTFLVEKKRFLGSEPIFSLWRRVKNIFGCYLGLMGCFAVVFVLGSVSLKVSWLLLVQFISWFFNVSVMLLIVGLMIILALYWREKNGR